MGNTVGTTCEINGSEIYDQGGNHRKCACYSTVWNFVVFQSDPYDSFGTKFIVCLGGLKTIVQ